MRPRPIEEVGAVAPLHIFAYIIPIPAVTVGDKLKGGLAVGAMMTFSISFDFLSRSREPIRVIRSMFRELLLLLLLQLGPPAKPQVLELLARERSGEDGSGGGGAVHVRGFRDRALVLRGAAREFMEDVNVGVAERGERVGDELQVLLVGVEVIGGHS